ncbi:MAG: 3-phosphoserine/phosphohydroxythreonine transaminase [Sutterellaceae bacterium]|nr:3-phosphoserine/phosphohydroxythreonine transaminase [Sutterellaceae bacterium]MDD7441330.1 3-phosphoserine/phosphohydroxythreonine transaminase [Sutterellaceae bacterium]MDY2868075.1 3-phosphoserine/phosphohydroxythreonine transaminase [Mesosutterella sp.]
MSRCYNFAPGPSTLPLPVLEQARDELLDFRGTGCSVMELSHRSREFTEVHNETQALLRELLGIPAEYDLLLMQGGGHMQFSMVPLNLLGKGNVASYIVNGTWSRKAAAEAARFCTVHVAAENPGVAAPSQDELRIDPRSSYVYYCDNETVHGVEFGYVPETGGIPLVADMSSNILSRPFDIRRFGAVWFGAQKNFGIAGLAIAAVRHDLIGNAPDSCPVMLNWKSYSDKNSMLNTPPTFAIYIANLVCHWIKREGGVKELERRASVRSKLLYDAIDGSDGFYFGRVEKESRSRMNVTFWLKEDALSGLFIEEAAKEGLRNIKGHRSIGGMRASVYNAMPVEGARELARFMNDFARRHG